MVSGFYCFVTMRTVTAMLAPCFPSPLTFSRSAPVASLRCAIFCIPCSVCKSCLCLYFPGSVNLSRNGKAHCVSSRTSCREWPDSQDRQSKQHYLLGVCTRCYPAKELCRDFGVYGLEPFGAEGLWRWRIFAVGLRVSCRRVASFGCGGAGAFESETLTAP